MCVCVCVCACVCDERTDDAGRLAQLSHLKARLGPTLKMKHLCQLIGCRLWSAVKAFLLECADLSTFTQSKSAQCAWNWGRALREAERVRAQGGQERKRE